MTYFLLLGSLFFSAVIYSQASELEGQWKPNSVQTESGIMTPQAKEYFLTITGNSLSCNLGVNTCKGAFTLNDNALAIDQVVCTFVCGDGRSDPISKVIHYEGTYDLRQTLLIITTAATKLFLERR
jgi:heat shock protein HslJ